MTWCRYRHHDYNFIDYDIQHLLPHKFSEYTPGLASGDLDGNGLDDLVIGGNGTLPTSILLQQSDGKFIQKNLPVAFIRNAVVPKDEGILIFDANGDGKPDIYISSGGYALAPGDQGYQDRLYINDGKGNFAIDTTALPPNHNSKFCVRALDYNGDGKPIFRFKQGGSLNYPRPVLLYFPERSEKAMQNLLKSLMKWPGIENIGMVCDALFTDFEVMDRQT